MNASTGKKILRCAWATNDHLIAYHDREWGVPQHDDRVLFEFLVLEGAQAGSAGTRFFASEKTIAPRSTTSTPTKFPATTSAN